MKIGMIPLYKRLLFRSWLYRKLLDCFCTWLKRSATISSVDFWSSAITLTTSSLTFSSFFDVSTFSEVFDDSTVWESTFTALSTLLSMVPNTLGTALTMYRSSVLAESWLVESVLIESVLIESCFIESSNFWSSEIFCSSSSFSISLALTSCKEIRKKC